MPLILRNVKQSALTFTELDGNFLYLSQSIIDLSETNSPVLQQSFTSNRAVGGITTPTTFAAGTSLESIIRDMLYATNNATLSNLALKNSAGTVVYAAGSSTKYVEVNSTFTFGILNFSATANSNGQLPINITFESSGNPSNGSTDFTDYVPNQNVGTTNNIALSTNRSITSNVPTEVTFTFSGTDYNSQDSITTSNKKLSFMYPFFYGVSRNNIDFWTAGNYISASAGITGSVTPKGNKTVTFYTNQIDNQNLWFAYPQSYGSLTDIRDDNNGDLLGGGFFVFQQVTEITSGGNSVLYNVYKSAATTTPANIGYAITFKF